MRNDDTHVIPNDNGNLKLALSLERYSKVFTSGVHSLSRRPIAACKIQSTTSHAAYGIVLIYTKIGSPTAGNLMKPTGKLLMFGFIACVILSTVVCAQEVDKRQAVPDAAAQKQAVERIKSIFPREYAATNRSIKVVLGQELLKLARAEQQATARFALYREAVQVASSAGDVATTFAAISGMRADYQINELAVRLFAIENLAGAVQSQEDGVAVAEAAEAVAGMLIAENRFDDAKKLLQSGMTVARKLRGTDHTTRLRDAAANIDAVAQRFAAVAASTETLKQNPADPAANVEVGRYECFDKGNWVKGLPHLAQGSDPALQKLAAQTLAKPAAAAAQHEIAEGWWKVAESLQGSSQTRTRSYATTFYQQALPSLSGLDRAMAQKRIAEFRPSSDTAAPTVGPRIINLLEHIDPDTDFRPQEKWALREGTLVCTEKHFRPKVIFPYQPPEEYDVTISFAQPELRNGVGLTMPNPNGDFSFGFIVGGNGGRELVLLNPERLYQRNVDNLLRPNVKYTLVFKVRKGAVKATINGVAVLDLNTDYSNLKVDTWMRIDEWKNLAISADDPTVFYQVEVTEISGEGVLTRGAKKP